MPLPSIISMLPNIPYFNPSSDKKILVSINSTDSFIRNRPQILKMRQDIKDSEGWTPLHLAANYHPESVKELLQAGANPNSIQNEGWTPLHFAARYKPKSIEELLQAGANPNIQNKYGDTPLHFAALYHPESIEALLRAGADPNLLNELGQTALHNAILGALKHPASFEALLKAGANPNIQAQNGSTPLHVAAQMNHPKEVFEKLIAHGAKIDLCNYEGKTFLGIVKDLDCGSYLKKVTIPTMREGIFYLRNEKGLVEEDLNLIYEPTNGTLYQNEGMVKLAVKSIIVFGATPFFVVGAMLQSLIYTVSDIATLFFNGRTIFKAEGTLAMVKSIVLGIPKAILDRVWEAIEMPLHGLGTMGYALYGLYNGYEARSRMNQAWGEGYLLKLSGMASFGNLRDTVEGKMKFYAKELKN